MRKLASVLLITLFMIPGCIDELPDKNWGEDVAMASGTYETLMQWGETNFTISFEVLNQDDNNSHWIDILTMTENNYDNFVLCDPYLTISELTWIDATNGDKSHDMTSDANGDTYIVADNGHCDDTGRDTIELRWNLIAN